MELAYDNAIEVKELNKKYKNFKLNNISFNIPKGRIVGFIGQNGSGKSTTINSILNLIENDSGDIKVFNMDYNKNSNFIKENIGVVFDDFNFHDILNVKELNEIFKRIYKKWDSNLYNNYTNFFSLPENQNIGTFSKGMKMKLAVIIALAQKPKLLIMDEATTGLDVGARDDILDLLLEFIQDEEHTVFFSSHITNDLEKIADYILLIHNGEIVIYDDKDNLIENFGILKSKKMDFKRIDQNDIVTFRSNELNFEYLVSNKEKAKIKYPKMVLDNATLDDILLFYIKGDKNERNYL